MSWPKGDCQLRKLEERIGYQFTDTNLLREALTHKSILQDMPSLGYKSYERLEFLGDAVMEFMVSDYYFNKFPKAKEGDLTDLRTRVVNGATLVLFSQALGLEDAMIISPSMEKITAHICEDVFEAVLAAIYLDGGMGTARDFLYNLIENIDFEDLDIRHPKNQLQEYIQSMKDHGELNYLLKKETGPDNDKTFYVDLVYNQKVLGQGVGKSKKEAETMAAEMALKKVKDERK